MSLLSTITENVYVARVFSLKTGSLSSRKNSSERPKLGENNSAGREGEKIAQSGAFLAGRALQGKQKIFWDWP